MKPLPFINRILMTMLLVAGTLLLNMDAFGQTAGNGTNCSTITADGDCSYAIGSGADAAGDHSISIGTGSTAGTATNGSGFAFGSAAYAEGENSVAIGIGVGTGSSNEYNIVIGSKGASNFTNTIDHSIMLGTKLAGSNPPTVYIEDPDLSSQSFGNVGIGLTTPESRMHVYDTLRVGVASTAKGSIVFNGNGNANTVSINSGVTTTSYDLYLPTAIGSEDDLLGLGTSGQLEWFSPSAITDAWLLGGNSGIGATDYLGTINSADLKIIAANVERMRIESGGEVGIGTGSPNGHLHVSAVAAGTQEKVARFGVADAAIAQSMQILNRSTTATEFAPWIEGGSTVAANSGLYLSARIQDTGNSGGTPAMIFGAFRSTWTDTLDRPCFSWRSHHTFMEMDANGNLGIGTTSPSGKLEVVGTLFANLSFDNAAPSMVLYDPTTNEILDGGTSTIFFKEDVSELDFDQEAFLNLQPVRFRWKEARGGKVDVGFIAQEVEATFPELAYSGPKRTYFADGSMLRDSLGVPVADTTQLEAWGVRYHKVPVYLMAITKQQHAISDLQQQVAELSEALTNCCVDAQQFRYSNEPIAEEVSKSLNEYILLSNDPNPFVDYTDIKYEATNCEVCEILVTDMNGRILKRIRTQGKSGTVRIYSSEIGKGVFNYSILENGQIIKTSKMVSTQ